MTSHTVSHPGRRFRDDASTRQTGPARPIVLMCVAMLLLAGCNGDPPAPSNNAPPLTGISVEVAAPAALRLSDQWRLQLDEWTAATGGEFEWHETGSDKMPDDELPPRTALAIVRLNQLPDLIAEDWPAELDDRKVLSDYDDLLRGLRIGIAQPAGEPHAIPTSCPVLAVYYRADLLEAAGRQPPQTWDDYQTLLDELSAWSGGLPALEPWGPEFRSSIWLARAAGYALDPDSVSILLDLQSAEPQIAGPPFIRALEDSLAAIKRLDPQSLELGPEDCCVAVLEGRAAMAIGIAPTEEHSSEAVAVSGDTDPAAVVDTAALPGAARVYERSSGAWRDVADGARATLVGYGGYVMCVSRTVDDDVRNAAWNLWAALRTQVNEDDLPFGPAVCRASDIPAAQLHVLPGFTPAEWRDHLAATVATLQETRVLLELPLPESVRFRELLTTHLDTVLNGTAQPADALQQAAADWQALIDELGRERVLNAYRQCHGLMPM